MYLFRFIWARNVALRHSIRCASRMNDATHVNYRCDMFLARIRQCSFVTPTGLAQACKIPYCGERPTLPKKRALQRLYPVVPPG